MDDLQNKMLILAHQVIANAIEAFDKQSVVEVVESVHGGRDACNWADEKVDVSAASGVVLALEIIKAIKEGQE